jgi:site-specific recombinase XerD
VWAAIRTKANSVHTEQAFVDWIGRFTLFHDKRRPDEMGQSEIEALLTHLSVNRNVAPSMQNQALSALFFLYRSVLGQELSWLDDLTQAKKPSRLPVVLTVGEVGRLFKKLSGKEWLMANLL